jgi:hypothetical protein
MDKHVTEARVDICSVIVQVIDEEEDAWVIGKK